MSVEIMINSPINSEEESFNIPVATEETFQRYWLKASNELGLEWMPIFETGIFVEKKDLPVILKEFDAFENWVNLKVSDEEIKDNIQDRINYIRETVPKIFTRNDIKIYIG